MQKAYVVIPNWNGASRLPACLDSLRRQSQACMIIVVDNGSTDDSIRLVEHKYPEVILIKHPKNLGFAGGVNSGINYAIGCRAKYVALLNNDAVADKDWLKNLVNFLGANPKAGIATSKILDSKGRNIDSTGEFYTTWGLPFSRGRGERQLAKYDLDKWVFGASGGGSAYRVKMLEQVGIFDEDFFAYYEDVDLSFRAQLAGWKIAFVPTATVHHQIGATSSKIKGFTTYQTLKNLPMLMWKNVPLALMPKVFPRFLLLYASITASALARGQWLPVAKGIFMSFILWPKKMYERYQIQKRRQVTTGYIDSLIVNDLPPGADKLRRLRNVFKTAGRDNA